MTFTPITTGLSRGPRPVPDDYPHIKDTYATVLSLEGMEEDIKEATELAPARVLSFPIGFVEIYLTGISQKRLTDILDALVQAQKPVLIHCQHGQDRTGLVVAAYRVRFQGWSKDWAMTEARQYGYRWWLNYGLNRTWKHFHDQAD